MPMHHRLTDTDETSCTVAAGCHGWNDCDDGQLCGMHWLRSVLVNHESAECGHHTRASCLCGDCIGGCVQPIDCHLCCPVASGMRPAPSLSGSLHHCALHAQAAKPALDQSTKIVHICAGRMILSFFYLILIDFP